MVSYHSNRKLIKTQRYASVRADVAESHLVTFIPLFYSFNKLAKEFASAPILNVSEGYTDEKIAMPGFVETTMKIGYIDLIDMSGFVEATINTGYVDLMHAKQMNI